MNKDINILSIDIDFLFKDCIKYQDYQDEDLTPEQSWQVVKWKYKKDFEFDTLAYMWLKEYIKKTCKNIKQLVIIEEHDEIVKYLKEWKCNLAYCCNIDNHHDITYHNDDKELNIENWVQHSRNDNLILEYHWIHQDNSHPCLYSPFVYKQSSWKDWLIEDDDREYDYVVLCLSKYFTPIEYWYLQKELSLFIQDNVEAFFLEEDEYNKDKDIVKSEQFKAHGYLVQGDLMSDDSCWYSFMLIDDEHKQPQKFMHWAVEKTKETLKTNNVVYGFKKDYKSKKIIEYLVRNLLKVYHIEEIETDNNKYYIINKGDN